MSNADVVRGLYEAFGEGDVPTVLGLLAPDVEWREAENSPYAAPGGGWDGPDAVVSIWTLHDGKVTRFQQYTDTGQFEAVMGPEIGKEGS